MLYPGHKECDTHIERKVFAMTYLLVLAFLATIVAAGVARAYHRDVRAWSVWIMVASPSWLMFFFHYDSVEKALAIVMAASVVGFLHRELWTAAKDWFSHPRVISWMIVGAAVVYLFLHPELWGPILMMAIVIFAIKYMLWPKKARKKR